MNFSGRNFIYFLVLHVEIKIYSENTVCCELYLFHELNKEHFVFFRAQEIFWMNKKAIIEFGLSMIWRIMQISAGVIRLNTLLDLHNSSHHTQMWTLLDGNVASVCPGPKNKGKGSKRTKNVHFFEFSQPRTHNKHDIRL